MKKVFGFITILPIVLFAINTYAFQNEPDGFRDIKWGTNLSTLKGITCEDTHWEETLICTRDNNKLQIGDVELSSISYWFWRNKFFQVEIHSTSPSLSVFSDLRDILREKFGPDRKFGYMFEWGNELSGTTYITLSHEVCNWAPATHSPYTRIMLQSVAILKERKLLHEQQEIMKKQAEMRKRKVKAKKGLNDF
jgi:hypothetical protein